jgi:hypothetical protein
MLAFNRTLQKNTETKITFRLLPHFGKILLKSSQCDTIHPQWEFVLGLSGKVEHRTCKHSWHSFSTNSSQGASNVSYFKMISVSDTNHLNQPTRPVVSECIRFSHCKSLNTFGTLFCTVGLGPHHNRFGSTAQQVWVHSTTGLGPQHNRFGSTAQQIRETFISTLN